MSSSTVPAVLTAISAAASTVAATTAVYVGVLRVHRTAPKLTILPFDETGPDLVELDLFEERAFWARVRILNDRRSRSASDAMVLVVSAEVITEDGSRVSLPLLAGKPLQWSEAYCDSVTVAPGVPRRVDLLKLSSPRPEGTGPELRLVILPTPQNSRRDVVPGRTIHLELALTERDVPATLFSVTADVDEGWTIEQESGGPPPILIRDIRLLS